MSKRSKRKSVSQTGEPLRKNPGNEPGNHLRDVLKKNTKTEPSAQCPSKKWTAGEIAVFVFASYMFIAFPLIFHNNYIDIQITKYRAFTVGAAVFVAAAAVLVIRQLLFGKSSKGSPAGSAADPEIRGNAGKKSVNALLCIPLYQKLMVLFSVILLLTMLITTLRVPWRSDALTGAIARRMGLISWAFCIAVFLIIMAFGGTKKQVRYPFAIGTGLVIFFVILNFLGHDPLGMYQNLVLDQHTYFISTVGNINVTSAYLCMTAAVLMVFFYRAENKKDRILFGLLSAAGVFAGYAAESDSFLIGMFGAFVVFLYVSLQDPAGMKKFWNLGLIFYGTTLLMKLIVSTVPGSDPDYISAFPADGLIGIVMKPAFLIAAGIILGLLILLETKVLSKRPALYPVIRKWLFIAFGAAVLIFAVLVFLANATGLGKSNSFFSKLVIRNAFGSTRGYIWKRSVQTFNRSSLMEKLFGSGPDCFYYAVAPYYGEEMSSHYGVTFTDAHCEFLQMLITTGLVGTVSYFGILITGLVHFIRNHQKSIFAFLGFVLVVTWLFQGIPNHPQIAVTPIFFVLFGTACGQEDVSHIRK